jgi:hypothetical protein
MSLDDTIGQDMDPIFDRLVVLFNACNEVQTFAIPDLAGFFLTLHPIQVKSHDPIVREANYNRSSGTFNVPARTTAVFVQPVAGSNI